MLFKIENGQTLIMKGELKNHDINTWKMTGCEYRPISDTSLFKEVLIKTPDNGIVGDKIHHQLVGNQNYIDCKIILNIDTEGEVLLLIDESSTDDIQIDADLNLKIFSKSKSC